MICFEFKDSNKCKYNKNLALKSSGRSNKPVIINNTALMPSSEEVKEIKMDLLRSTFRFLLFLFCNTE